MHVAAADLLFCLLPFCNVPMIQNVFLSVKDVGWDFVFLLVYFVTSFQASYTIYSNSCWYGSIHFWPFGHKGVKHGNRIILSSGAMRNSINLSGLDLNDSR